jgi:glutathione synthase/RimK-type ligase-like ATP-grasp enzyme
VRNLIFIRRRRLGRGSTAGIIEQARLLEYEGGLSVCRTWTSDPRPGPDDIAVRWGCTAEINHPKALTLNRSDSIHWAADKAGSRMDMQHAYVPGPDSWTDEDEFNIEADETARYIYRPGRHAQGRDLHFCTKLEAYEFLYLNEGGYASVYIPKVAEYRVFVMRGAVVWVAKKTPADPSAIAWNVAQGGRFDNVRWGQWPAPVLRAAIQAHNLSGLDFSGVDVMVDADGNPYVLEVNSAPSQTSPYRQACVAKALIWTADNLDVKLSFDPAATHWRKYIHPALLTDEE